jgi:hypothetical protein
LNNKKIADTKSTEFLIEANKWHGKHNDNYRKCPNGIVTKNAIKGKRRVNIPVAMMALAAPDDDASK